MKKQQIICVSISLFLMSIFLGVSVKQMIKAENYEKPYIELRQLKMPETRDMTNLTLNSAIEAFKGQEIVFKDDVEKQIRAIAVKNGFKWIDYLIRLGYCESRLNPNALGDNGNSRGLYQIHKGYHPEVSDKMAYDIEQSTLWTMNKINNGYQHLWSCDKIIKHKSLAQLK